jgi:hypothetical protein
MPRVVQSETADVRICTPPLTGSAKSRPRSLRAVNPDMRLLAERVIDQQSTQLGSLPEDSF